MSRFSDFLKNLVEPTPQVVESEPAPVGYNENATDRDGDGLVQDGTDFERPAPVKTTRKRSK